MRSKKYSEKRQFIRTEKRLEKKHYRILIGLAIFGAGYYYLIEPETIGHDSRYNMYIFWLPTMIGVLVLAMHRRRFLTTQFSINKGAVLWTAMILLYLAEGFMVSYLSFGQVAKISWDILNERVCRENKTETLTFDVTEFSRGSYRRGSPSINFRYNGKLERINVPYSTIKVYKNEDPKDYELMLEVNKGIWNFYKLKSWELTRK